MDSTQSILYIFFTHRININKVYDRITNMMNNHNSNDFIIVQGGFNINTYDKEKKILNIQCNDKYEGLPEKIFKTYKYLIESQDFNHYTHFLKLDEDMIIKNLINKNIYSKINYGGIIQNCVGNREWHIGKCSHNHYYNTNSYKGIYVPWCLGGYGYIISRSAIEIIKNNTKYFEHIYEDLYIAITLLEYNIRPVNINIKDFVISPEHK
jgi:hypothetical protein